MLFTAHALRAVAFMWVTMARQSQLNSQRLQFFSHQPVPETFAIDADRSSSKHARFLEQRDPKANSEVAHEFR